MAFRNFTQASKRVKTSAKKILDADEYEKLKLCLKSFNKTGCVSSLCLSLIEIIQSPEKAALLVEIAYVLPETQRAEFNAKYRELLKQRVRKRGSNAGTFGASNENFDPLGSPSKRMKRKDDKASKRKLSTASNQTEDHKTIILERESDEKSFGFKIKGDLFTQSQVIVSVVDKSSVAEKAGLKQGDQIIRINNKDCRSARKVDVVALVKSENTIYMRVKQCRDMNNKGVGVSMGTDVLDDACKKVTLYTDEDGWLGCSVRGGVDYDCEVHLIDVDSGSPAERAGLRKGDEISKVNGRAVKGMTHVQIVRLIVTAGSPITFTVKPSPQRHTGHRRLQNNHLPNTPLRMLHHRGRHSMQTRMPLLPQYTPQDTRQSAASLVQSPSSLPLQAITLACSPPPPYSEDPPTEHRVLQRGEAMAEAASQEINEDALLNTDSSVQAHVSYSSVSNEDCSGAVGGSDSMVRLDDRPDIQESSISIQQPGIVTISSNEFSSQECCDGVAKAGVHKERHAAGNVRKALGFEVEAQDHVECVALEVEHPAVQENPMDQPSNRPSVLSDIRNFSKSLLKSLASVPTKQGSLLDERHGCNASSSSDAVSRGSHVNNVLAVIGEVMQRRARVMHETLNNESDVTSDDSDWEV